MSPDLYRLLIALGIGAIIGAGYKLLSLFATLIVLSAYFSDPCSRAYRSPESYTHLSNLS